MFRLAKQLPEYPHLSQYPSPSLLSRMRHNPALYQRINDLVPYFEKRDSDGLHAAFPAFNISFRSVSVIEELAWTGQHAFVDWLISREIGGSKNSAALGYAAGGYYAELDKLLLAGVHIKFKIRGLAKVGEVEMVNQLVAESDNPNWLIRFAVIGYAQAGNVKQVEHLIANGEHCLLAIAGYAAGGHHDLVDDLIKRGFRVNEAAFNYAINGYVDKVNQLLTQGAQQTTVVYGYAIGGHVQYVLEMLKIADTPAISHKALAGYAYGRHSVVKSLLNDVVSLAQFNILKRSYAFSGDIDTVNKLLTMDSNSNEAIYGYSLGGYIEEAEILGVHVDRVILHAHASSANLQLIRRFITSENKLNAISVLATNRYINEINLLLQPTSIEIEAVAIVLAASIKLEVNKEIIRYMFAMIKNDKLREAFFFKAIDNSKNMMPVDKVTIHADRLSAIYNSALGIHKTMSKYNLTYRQALALSVMGVRAWIFHGIPMVLRGTPWLENSKDLNLDCYFEITYQLTQLHREDILAIYAALCLYLNNKINDEPTYLRRVGLFSPQPESLPQRVSTAGLNVEAKASSSSFPRTRD